MRTVGAYDAKTHLSHLLDAVSKGESITITKHGRPIAQLVPATPASRVDPDKAISELRALRRGVTLGGSSLREMIQEGRK